MAIVEDEVRNESEEENEIEVVVEEDDVEIPDSDDSDDEDEDMILERKVTELERRIAEDPYNYDEHVDLIQALWGLSSLERWRSAFERLQQLSSLRPEHWLMRLQTEVTLAHTEASRDRVANLFQEASLDCYSIPILSEWCSWSLTVGGSEKARAQLDEVLRRAGADPFSGKIFWDAKLELEKAQLEAMSPEDTEYKAQQKRVLWCLEEAVSRPLLRGEEALPQLEELALVIHDQEYVDKVKKQHEAAVDYLHKITPFEDKLLTLENRSEKCKVYQEYIDTIKDLANDEKYVECDSNGILRVVYDRATTECICCPSAGALLGGWARHAAAQASRSTCARVLHACTRRCPRRATFWTLRMQHAEHDDKTFEEIKTIFETALSKGMESYKENEALWMSYLEYMRRRTALDNEDDVEKLRRTFRLAWDSLAEAWGEEANDCEVPLFWARLEYKVLNDHKQGKMIFEEIFKYGENKTMSKYWEVLISLESNRSPRPSENKLRDLMRRALRSVKDYPPSIARLWTDYERDHGHLDTLKECMDACEAKVKEWRDNYQAMKDKMIGKKQKGKQTDSKKSKFDKKKTKEDNKDSDKGKGKRKSDGSDESTKEKRKKDAAMEVDAKDEDSGGGVKRTHDNDEPSAGDSKRQRTSSNSPHRLGTKDVCTLFVSNLDFKVDEQELRDKLSKYGEIISFRIRRGIKAFGGSICYCQYKSPDSVEEALKQDRVPLDGRPMFFSPCFANSKSKPSFKYSMEPEKNKLFVKNLPFAQCSKEELTEVFDKFGKLRDIRVVTFKDGKPKGLAYIEYEDEASATEAVAKANGMMLGERRLHVVMSAPPPRQSTSADGTLGQPKRDATGGMRRTQLSSFIPSVLQKASTSTAPPAVSQGNGSTSTEPANGNSSTEPANGNHSNGDKPTLTNNDFRTLLLKKQ